MFFIGISGAVLPYLVLIGFVLIFSVSMNGSAVSGNGMPGHNDPVKHLIYTGEVKVVADNTSNLFLADFTSIDNCRGDCNENQDFVEADDLLISGNFVVREINPFPRKSFKGRCLAFRYFGLSPPFFS